VLETQVTFSSTAIYQLSAIPIRYPGHFSHGSLKVNSNQRVVLKKHQTHIINDGRLPASRRLPGTSTSKIQISSQSCCCACYGLVNKLVLKLFKKVTLPVPEAS